METLLARVTPVTLKMRLRSHGANLTCVAALYTSVPSFLILGQIFLEILSGNHFGKHQLMTSCHLYPWPFDLKLNRCLKDHGIGLHAKL